MDFVTVLLICSLALNIVLATLIALQRVGHALAASAINDLLDRIGKLESATRGPQKIAIVPANNKENTSNEQSTTQAAAPGGN